MENEVTSKCSILRFNVPKQNKLSLEMKNMSNGDFTKKKATSGIIVYW